MLANSIVWQGLTGYSVGKRAVGLRLAYVPESKDTTTWTFLTPGVVRCALRFVLHILDLICFVGLVKAILNCWGKSFADEITRCVVIQDSRIKLMTRDEVAAVLLRILLGDNGDALPRVAVVSC